MRMCRFLMLAGVALIATGAVDSAYAADAAAPAAKIDLNRGQAIATQVCAACHAADGNSTSGAYPKLAGQPAEYLYKELNDFKIQPGAKAPARNNAIMAGFATALSDADMHNVAAYFSSQQRKPGYAKNKATLAMGEQIYRGGIAEKGVPACAACHGATGAGVPIQYPWLGGQWQDYTVAELTAFQTGTRMNSQPMHDIAGRLSDAEVKAVADYVAGLH